MGNTVHVSNRSEQGVLCLSFNNFDCCRWLYKELIHAPAGGERARLYGLPGGGAVQVAVVFKMIESCRIVFYDLFQVKDGATLVIREVTPERGVVNKQAIVNESGGKVKVLDIGRSIQLDRTGFVKIFAAMRDLVSVGASVQNIARGGVAV